MRRKPKISFHSLSAQRCGAEHVRRMWNARESVCALPLQGPHRVLNEEDLREALVGLVKAFGELCLRDLKHKKINRTSVLHKHHEDELEQIAERFVLKNREGVCDFLKQHRSLIPILVEVRKKFEEYFNVNEQLPPRLEVFTDPEDQQSTPKLFALVLTALPFKDASSRLDRLDSDWWLRQPGEVKRAMNIDIEYL